ncbi:mechanosensitive ion channel domain-containing protein [Mucilaginibacter jinjuensis]|uniref:Mechanosensitive ion channel n=1 Tax=Mucilaginibacter jinjuensis TaxID=1176721 RepID=A0ABY7TD48_9SPHI|nr:mechanosensitive ion channel domain-containing protein [Mucilaginibacter jinjuensis]WCT13102.1 mechanosensitive ion channel [Mucilaginibacter jinjuensis]
MKLVSVSFTKYLIALLITFVGFTAAAQQKNALQPTDSVPNDYVSRINKIQEEEAKKSMADYRREKEEIKQQQLMEDMKKLTQKVKIFIKTGIDSAAIDQELEHIKSVADFVGDGIFTHKGTAQTYRNLTTSSKILTELLSQVDARKKEIDAYERNLINFRLKTDSIQADPAVYHFPQDSVQIGNYLHKLRLVVKDIAPTDTVLKYATNNVHKLQEKLNLVSNRLNNNLAEIEDYQKTLASKTFEREFPDLGADVGYTRPFDQIIHFSVIKTNLILLFYAEDNAARIFLIFICIAISTFFLRSLKQIINHEDSENKSLAGELVLHYPFLSAVVIVLNLGQFIFPSPPFAFNCLFWLISSVCLTFIFNRFILRFWMVVWLTFLAFFILSCGDNIILQATRTERWGMLALAIIGALFALFVLIAGRKKELREKLILYFIALVLVLEILSVIANIYGRYNLAKSLLTSGYLSVIIGILFLWTIRLINEGLYIASTIYTQQDRKLFYINFNRVGERVPALFYAALILGWFILFGRNFYVFKFISDPLKQLFFDERTVGSYTFTINNLLVFFVILSVSILASRIVSYFVSEQNTGLVTGDGQRKAGVGSWLLLIRVFIISTGLFLALAAAGFPIERITLIIGALGVGVGFGLQTLVNNLVSGLIIAFEKPVNVGDIVEIAGQGGTIKSIGFRSSIISKWDGPDVVIPNGDLLNAHLVNWTLAGSKRQMDIVIGVAYGTDLQKPQQILYDLMDAHERIHHHPKPVVLFLNFNSSSIDLKAIFWVRDYKEGSTVKSELIKAIDVAFKQNDIAIPFPQQDVYIHPVDNNEPDDEAKPKTNKTK